MKRTALYAGSFDPITNGHINIIERAAGIFDEVTVAVGVNPSKSGMFTVDERMDMIRQVTRHIPNVRVDSFGGLLADYVNANGFDAVVRGLRGYADLDSEMQMANMNARLYTGGTETVFLMTDPEYSFVSSSIVREVASLGGSIEGLVPEYVIKKFRDKNNQEE